MTTRPLKCLLRASNEYALLLTQLADESMAMPPYIQSLNAFSNASVVSSTSFISCWCVRHCWSSDHRELLSTYENGVAISNESIADEHLGIHSAFT